MDKTVENAECPRNRPCCLHCAIDGAFNTRWAIDRERSTESYTTSRFHTRRRPSSDRSRFKESCRLRLSSLSSPPAVPFAPPPSFTTRRLCCDNGEDKSTPGDVTPDLACSETVQLPSEGDSFAASTTRVGPGVDSQAPLRASTELLIQPRIL